MAHLTESVIEQAAPVWPESLVWAVKHGPAISPGGAYVQSSRSG